MKKMMVAICAMVAAFAALAKELAAKYKAELASRETAAGPMVFEVRHGNAVEVELASAAHQHFF